jgi:hypothetical protein
MNAYEQPDPILRLLADLRPMAPSAALDRRVISRCHASLARQRRLQAAAAQSRAVRARVVELTMAAGIGVYGVSAAIEIVRLTLLAPH